jgi:hypothetical protein
VERGRNGERENWRGWMWRWRFRVVGEVEYEADG